MQNQQVELDEEELRRRSQMSIDLEATLNRARNGGVHPNATPPDIRKIPRAVVLCASVYAILTLVAIAIILGVTLTKKE
ncbi:Oidioi.mRNA.OKI2018_I69.XSR.g16887.t1.cds [Oikopleura dioica]|uniref:Oidioi.mRNA.OKI2018_I69.XSR.g16887.t1.cds n=1 Tax=Oikopleura dioica TaxID=34765 RepID=A0ABN7SRV8_OIKDI|nr:Oidioi.mRNA.OKI2018_I69.XSR.g16887.t1.cds [Oikopleura dioica]